MPELERLLRVDVCTRRGQGQSAPRIVLRLDIRDRVPRGVIEAVTLHRGHELAGTQREREDVGDTPGMVLVDEVGAERGQRLVLIERQVQSRSGLP